MSTRHGFTVEVIKFEEIHALPGAWTSDRYREMLEIFDFDEIDEISDTDLPDMAAMAAQDAGRRQAADHVLLYVFGDSMSPGIRQNLIDDLGDDRPFEQFVEVGGQARIFEAVEFLQKAFPSDFGIPDAARVRIRLSATGKHETEWLRAGPAPSLLVRLLAAAMDDRATLRRLFGDQIESSKFPEAEGLVWRIISVEDDLDGSPASRVLDVYSSLQWLEPLRDSEGITESDAEPDQ